MAATNDARVPATRRTLLAGVGTAGAAVALSACGTAAPSDTGSGSTGGGNGGGAGADPAGGTSLAKTTDIPVGSGKILDGIVVTQPTAGTFKAFSSTCTHQGCQVSTIADGLIKCPCHGSEFSIVDGSVKGGPAPEPLPAKQVTVQNGEISLA